MSVGLFGPNQACLESEGLEFDLPSYVADTSSGGSFGFRVRRRGVFPSAPAWFQGGYCPRWRRFGLNLTCPRERLLPAGVVARRGEFLGMLSRSSSSRSRGGFGSGRRRRGLERPPPPSRGRLDWVLPAPSLCSTKTTNRPAVLQLSGRCRGGDSSAAWYSTGGGGNQIRRRFRRSARQRHKPPCAAAGGVSSDCRTLNATALGRTSQ